MLTAGAAAEAAVDEASVVVADSLAVDEVLAETLGEASAEAADSAEAANEALAVAEQAGSVALALVLGSVALVLVLGCVAMQDLVADQRADGVLMLALVVGPQAGQAALS